MGIPILMYHEVDPRDTFAERYTVGARRFREQMSYLHDNGYRTISLEEYRRQAIERSSWPHDKQVVITFDDNHLSHFSICTPMLAEFGFTATFFVVTSFLDTTADLLYREHLREMKRAGMSIESHSHTHRFLDDLNAADLDEELRAPRRVLEDCLGSEVRYMSCPGGRYNREVLDVAPSAGYYGVCTSVPGINQTAAGRWPKGLNRFLISATTPLQTFAKIASGERNYVRREVLRDRAKTAVKGLLGNHLYHTLWQRYRKEL